MALSATIRRFQIELSDVDRGVYDNLELQAAQHPSESEAYLVTRVLAMALEHCDGLTFGRGVSTPDDPTIFVADPTGQILLWVDVGQPSADRLHKVTKQAARVCVYTHKNPERLLAELAAGGVHRGDEIEVVAFDSSFVDELAEIVARNNDWSVLRSEGIIYVTSGGDTFQTTPHLLGAAR